jgi:hypothetical protein
MQSQGARISTVFFCRKISTVIIMRTFSDCVLSHYSVTFDIIQGPAQPASSLAQMRDLQPGPEHWPKKGNFSHFFSEHSSAISASLSRQFGCQPHNKQP